MHNKAGKLSIETRAHTMPSTVSSAAPSTPRTPVQIAPSVSVALVSTIALACFLYLRPEPDNVGRPCMWRMGHYTKFHCVDDYEDTCVRLSDVENRTYSALTVATTLEHVVTRGTNGTVVWKWGEPSMCRCLPGFSMHRGQCIETLPVWTDADYIVSLVGTYVLCTGVFLVALCRHCCPPSDCTYLHYWAYGLNCFAFLVFIFLSVLCIRAGIIYGRY